MLLYYITDRTQLPGDETARRRRLLDKIAEATRCGVNYIQLREKDLTIRDLESLAHAAVRTIQENQLRTGNQEARTAFLMNSRTDVAIATGADGVHLRSEDISANEVNKCRAGAPARLKVAVSCHSRAEVAHAATEGADFAVFAPVFEKNKEKNTNGLEALRKACQEKIPVLALGGITLENSQTCQEAGAAGIAGIRIFQENDIAKVIAKLR